MKLILICPLCGLPGVKVNSKAVSFNLLYSKKTKDVKKNKWSACVNPACGCSYYSGKKTFLTGDLSRPLFYKDGTGSVPVCYCSDITRDEIRSAIIKGCKTIREVHKNTGKSKTGDCERKNPLGKCCKQVFLKTIVDLSSKQE